jgi:hypothetical protein
MAKYAEITVKGSSENLRNLAHQALASDGFNVTWESPSKGKAEKGSLGANIALGGFAQRHVVGIEIFPGTQGGTLRIETLGRPGLSGGLIGARKVSKQLDVLSDTLATWFSQQGLLMGVKKQRHTTDSSFLD